MHRSFICFRGLGSIVVLSLLTMSCFVPRHSKKAQGTSSGAEDVMKGREADEGLTAIDPSEFEKGQQPVPVSGVNLVDYNNARVRCDYTKNVDAANSYRAQCVTVVHTVGNQEVVADGIKPGVDLSWQAPKTVSGELSYNDCRAAGNNLSYLCTVTLANAGNLARVEFAIEVTTKIDPPRKEAVQMTLPYSVGVTAGLVPAFSSRYQSQQSVALADDPGADGGGGGARVGFQQYDFPSNLASLTFSQGLCTRRDDIFFSSGGVIYLAHAGRITPFAGSNNPSNADNFTHRLRVFIQPYQLVCMSDGVMASSPGTNRIFRFYDDGRVELIAGNKAYGYSPDGSLAKDAALSSPVGLAINGAGQVFFSEAGAYKIRTIDKSGKIQSVAGTSRQGTTGDGGNAIDATLNSPKALVIGPDQAIYFVETFAHVVRKISTDGKISRVAGTGTPRYTDRNVRSLSEPISIWMGPSGRLLISENYQGVKEILPDGSLKQIVSAGPDLTMSATEMVDAIQRAAAQRQSSPYTETLKGRASFDGFSLNSNGGLLSAGPFGILLWDLGTGAATPFAGAPQPDAAICGTAVSAAQTQLFEASTLTYGPGDSLYLMDWQSDLSNRLVVRNFYAEQGQVKLKNLYGCAGELQLSSQNPLPALGQYGNTGANSIGSLQVAPDGTVYASNMVRNIVFKIPPGGSPITIAGTGVFQAGADGGLAVNTPLQNPMGLALGPNGTVYIGEAPGFVGPGGSRIRMIGADGRISTVVGTGADGDTGEGGPATQATLRIANLTVAADGRLFIADFGNSKVKMVDKQGIISTIAGGGTITDFSKPIDARQALINGISSVAVTNDATVFAITFDKVLQIKQNRAGVWELSTFFGQETSGDCGVGRVAGRAAEGQVDSAIRASMSVICQGLPRSVTVRDTCPKPDGQTRIAIGQGFDHFINIVEIVRPCGA